ncbi:hypothetical protein [Microbacterium sp.]|uniref:hypothetical protein n=1 Tax=Microbacterium sp. TaxID=51671 RepID=UPI003F6FB127
MKFRMLSATAVVLSVVLGASGCAAASPVAVPTETPAFATDEEAFAAAEQTYRAYVDALNQVDLSDPATFEPVYALTTGEANAGSREEFSQMHAEGLTVAGSTSIDLIDLHGERPIEVDVCLRVSDVTLTNPSGKSVVAPDRPDVQMMRVRFAPGDTRTGLLIDLFTGRRDGQACES